MALIFHPKEEKDFCSQSSEFKGGKYMEVLSSISSSFGDSEEHETKLKTKAKRTIKDFIKVGFENLDFQIYKRFNLHRIFAP